MEQKYGPENITESNLNEKAFEELKSFISKNFGISEDEILKTSFLEKDLGIFGDDALDLLLMYSKNFNVDLSELHFKKYVSPEGDTILPALIRLFTGKKNPRESDLTIAHLIKGIHNGRLNEEIINL